VYDDDIVVHGSDYGPDGEDNLGYFRTFASLLDDTDMKGNCADAGTEWKQNEMFPCINNNITYGTAITGLDGFDPITSVPTSLIVNATAEPDIREGNAPAIFQATLLIGVDGGLTEGSYSISRFDGVDEFREGKRSAVYRVDVEEAQSEPLEFVDEETFLSSSSVYFTVEKN
jgi:hypothetical protein